MIDTSQIEFDFEYTKSTENVIQKSIAEIESDLNVTFKYRRGKYIDFICDHIPYAWRVYYKCLDLRRWCISTYQKIRYGVSNEECWNLADTFARYILPRLKHYKQMNRMGIPSDMFVKWHPDYSYPGTGNEKDAEQRWNVIIDEMIWTFEYIMDPDKFLNFPDELSCRNRTDKQDVCDWIIRDKTEREKQLWSIYMTQCDTLDKRKQRGLQLFAKHYESLWD